MIGDLSPSFSSEVLVCCVEKLASRVPLWTWCFCFIPVVNDEDSGVEVTTVSVMVVVGIVVV